MLQSILFFVLGFLCAGFLALMVAPSIWRRAVMLTRKRIEASVPLTLAEIQADKDRMRAEFAMTTRRLEMNVKSLRERSAAQLVELDRSREELRRLSEEGGRSDVEASAEQLRAELGRSEKQLQGLTEKLAQAEKMLEEKALEIDRLGRLYEEASFSSSSRQIDLVARESEVEKLSGDVTALIEARRDLERSSRELSDDSRIAREALIEEKRRAEQLDRSLQRLTAELGDREETLGRREQEVARLREMLKAQSQRQDEVSAELAATQSDRLALETQVAGMTLQLSNLSGAKREDVDEAAGRTGERDRLQKRLDTVTRENRRLKELLAAREQSDSGNEDGREGALLREQLNDLAAQVIRLTAQLDGPDSPIAKALAAPARNEQGAGSGGQVTSLADRVRALQRAASAGR